MSIIPNEEMIGKRFNKLIVLSRTEKPENIKDRHWYYLCQCDCGNTSVVCGRQLRTNRTKSCGCLRYDFAKINLRKYNKYNLLGEYGIGYFKNGETFYFDLEDYDKIKEYYWRKNTNGYTRTSITINGEIKRIYLHHLLLGNPNDLKTDHINRNRLDNRKSNLRMVTNQENCINKGLNSNNTSGFIGVSFSNVDKKWDARLRINYKTICLGNFKNKQDAIIARLKGEKQYFGEFAPQKHLFKQYNII